MKTILFILFIVLAVCISELLCLYLEDTTAYMGGFTLSLFITTKLLNCMERKLAMEWWNNLSIMVKIPLAQKYVNRSNPDSLTGREIELIYNQEHKPINV